MLQSSDFSFSSLIFVTLSTCYRNCFAESSRTYNNLGPFNYKPEDFSKPIEVKYDDESVSVGQFKAGTNALHGIGIRVKKDGSIEEGHWKDDKKDGEGRYTDITINNILYSTLFSPFILCLVLSEFGNASVVYGGLDNVEYNKWKKAFLSYSNNFLNHKSKGILKYFKSLFTITYFQLLYFSN